MVFVSDIIPAELRRIIEFLNSQMNPGEVLGIEIKQFAGSGITTLVPEVIGQTAQAAARREGKTRTARQWDRDSFFQALAERRNDKACAVAQALFQWCDNVLPLIWWGTGKNDGSCFRGVQRENVNFYPFAVWTYGRVEIQFQSLKGRPPFEDETLRREFLRRLNQVPGLELPADSISRRPTFDIMLLADPSASARYRDAIEWAVSVIGKAHPHAAHPDPTASAPETS